MSKAIICYHFKCLPSKLRGEDPLELELISEALIRYDEQRPMNQLIKQLSTKGIR